MRFAIAALTVAFAVPLLWAAPAHSKDSCGDLSRGDRGPCVGATQWLLGAHRPAIRRGAYWRVRTAEPSGFYGAATARQTHRIKYRLGFPRAYLNGVSGPLLRAYLTGRRKLPRVYQHNLLNRYRSFKGLKPLTWGRPPPPSPSPEQPACLGSVFCQPGGWVVNGVHANRFNTAYHEALASRLVSEGFRWIAFPLTSGLGTSEWTRENYGMTEIYRHHGLKVCGWGALDSNPGGDAAVTRQILTSQPWDCYIADAENGYITNWPGYVSNSSAIFVSTLGHPSGVELAVSTFPTTAFDHQAWIREGYAMLPQAYLCLDGQWTGAYVTALLQGQGWPASRIHPVYGRYSWGCTATPLSTYLSSWPGRTDYSMFVVDE